MLGNVTWQGVMQCDRTCCSTSWRVATRNVCNVMYVTWNLNPLLELGNHSAISHRNPDFQQMTRIWPFKVTKGQTDYAIRSATYDFLLVFYSNYSAISHGNPVFRQMILIWPSKVTKSQTDYAIRSAIYGFQLTFHSNYSAIYLARKLCFSMDDLDLTLQGHQRSNWLCHQNWGK